MSDGAEYCGKSGEIKEKREYLEAESRGIGVSPSWILWGFLAGRLAGRLETWRNAKAEEDEIWKRVDGKSNVGEMPRGMEGNFGRGWMKGRILAECQGEENKVWQRLGERSNIGEMPRQKG